MTNEERILAWHTMWAVRNLEKAKNAATEMVRHNLRTAAWYHESAALAIKAGEHLGPDVDKFFEETNAAAAEEPEE